MSAVDYLFTALMAVTAIYLVVMMVRDGSGR